MTTPPPQYVVRYGVMRTLGVMTSPAMFAYGDQVVTRTDRGTEVATVLCEATPAALDYMSEATAGEILRPLTQDDRRRWDESTAMAGDDLRTCDAILERHDLAMELVEVERLLGGEKVVIYFTAPQRVDFRSLVRDLAAVYQTRIELRQIGSRDEAKLLADYGDCGRPICCANHLSKMPPVSMKMVKLQKTTLDPSKISGRCGRLKCCLRYEFETYESLAAELPPIGAKVLTRDGTMVVLGQDVLSGQLLVSTEDRRRVLIQAADVLTVTGSG